MRGTTKTRYFGARVITSGETRHKNVYTYYGYRHNPSEGSRGKVISVRELARQGCCTIARVKNHIQAELDRRGIDGGALDITEFIKRGPS